MSRSMFVGVLVLCMFGATACSIERRFHVTSTAEPDAHVADPDAAQPEADAATNDGAIDFGDSSVTPDVDGHFTDAAIDDTCVPPNLMGCDLRGADFSGKDLRGWNFTNADLRGADLSNATLKGANLSGAILENNNLYRLRAYDLVGCPVIPWGAPVQCRLQAANGRFALVGPMVRLDGANLEGASLDSLDLTAVYAVNLRACPDTLPLDWSCIAQSHNGRFALVGPGASLEGADLEGANLEGANLEGAGLGGASLRDASLQGANLRRATLFGATVAGASFVGTDLSEVRLSDIDWTGADLTDAVLYHAATRALIGCPSKLSADYRCLAAADAFVILGPHVNASSSSLAGADLDGLDLTGANLDAIDFDGASLTGATLTGVSAARLLHCPKSLPTGWVCAWTRVGNFGFGPYRVLLGPGAAPSGNLDGLLARGFDLTNADFRNATVTGADLRDTTLTGARFGVGSLAYSYTGPIERCPLELPPGYQCFQLPGGSKKVVLGPTVIARGLNLSGLDLGGLDLHAVDLRGSNLTGAALDAAVLTGARAVNLTGCPTKLPGDGFRCVAQPDLSLSAIVGPDMVLSDANLRGADLTDVSLTGATTIGTRLFDLQACPTDFPNETGWSCVMQPKNGRFAMLGNLVDLRGADLSGVDAAGAALNGAHVSGANFAGATLTGAQMRNISDWQGADLTGASITGALLDGAKVHGLLGCPVLPDVSWQCAATAQNDFALLGPTLSPPEDLVGADLTGVNFENQLYGCNALRAFDLTACPAALPAGWTCVEQPMAGTYAVFGPSADLRDADLRGVTFDPDSAYLEGGCTMDLRGADLGGAHLKKLGSVRAQDLLECPAELPSDAWQCFAQGNGLYALAGPGVRLEDIDFDGADLADVDLSQVYLANFRATDLDACPLALPEGGQCVMLQNTGKYALTGAGADLRGIDLSGVTLPSGTRAHDLLACPAVLPANTACVEEADGHFAVIGFNADLSGADLNGADLSSTPSIIATRTAATDRVRAYDLIGCPELRNWDVCVHQPNNDRFLVLGAFMADLVGTDLTGVDLSHMPQFGWFAAYDLIGCPSALAPSLVCVLQPANNKFAILGTDLRGADLAGVAIPPHFVGTLPSDATTTCPNGDPGPCVF